MVIDDLVELACVSVVSAEQIKKAEKFAKRQFGVGRWKAKWKAR